MRVLNRVFGAGIDKTPVQNSPLLKQYASRSTKQGLWDRKCCWHVENGMFGVLTCFLTRRCGLPQCQVRAKARLPQCRVRAEAWPPQCRTSSKARSSQGRTPARKGRGCSNAECLQGWGSCNAERPRGVRGRSHEGGALRSSRGGVQAVDEFAAAVGGSRRRGAAPGRPGPPSRRACHSSRGIQRWGIPVWDPSQSTRRAW